MGTKVLIAGESLFVKRETIREIKRKFSDREIRVFDAALDEVPAMLNWIGDDFSFFGDGKVCILDNVEKARDDESGTLTSAIENDDLPTTIFFVEGEGSLDKRLKLSKLIEKKCKVVKCDPPKQPDDWASWIVERAKHFGKSITHADAQGVLRFVGKDQFDLDRELRKVAMFVGDRTEITQPDLASVLTRRVQHQPWDLTDAMGRKELTKALIYTRRFIQDNGEIESTNILLSVFFKFFERLLVVEGEMRAGTGMQAISEKIGERYSPYFEQKYKAYTAKWSGEQAVAALSKLCQIDLNVKTRGIDGPNQLEWFLISAIGSAPTNS